MHNPHPILDEISESEGNRDGATATVLFAGRSIPVTIDPDDRTMDETIEFAAAVVEALPRLEGEAKRTVVRDLRPTYNDGWNEYQEQQDDGTYKNVTNLQLTEEEFASNLTLKIISITGATGIDFWYDDSDMFWGHGVFVSCLDGLDLSGAKAELFG